MHTDDTHTTIPSNDIAELLSMTKKELLNISDLLRVNKLRANPQNTEFVVIGHQRRINAINDHSRGSNLMILIQNVWRRLNP